jgi:hypothetical protein
MPDGMGLDYQENQGRILASVPCSYDPDCIDKVVGCFEKFYQRNHHNQIFSYLYVDYRKAKFPKKYIVHTNGKFNQKSISFP